MRGELALGGRGDPPRTVPVLSAVVGLAGCTTTTRLEPVAGSSLEQSVEQLAVQPGAHARVTIPAPPLQPIADGGVVGHETRYQTGPE